MDIFNKLIIKDAEANTEPQLDIAICSSCGWKGPVSDCETQWESEGWEYPEYQIHLCPKCLDGGCIDDYEYSPETLHEYQNWKESKKENQ